jgi:Protein of unknown function (DUF2752)
MRYYSVPERWGVFSLGMGGAVLGYQAISRATGLPAPCLMRMLTGVPCPLCGMTTAAAGLAGGDISAAVSANPFIVCVAALAATGLLLLGLRAIRLIDVPKAWSAAARRRVGSVVMLLAIASWFYQLHRYGFV